MVRSCLALSVRQGFVLHVPVSVCSCCLDLGGPLAQQGPELHLSLCPRDLFQEMFCHIPSGARLITEYSCGCQMNMDYWQCCPQYNFETQGGLIFVFNFSI